MASSIGSYGEKLDLKIRQGATFGPVTATMVNPPDELHLEEWPVDLTGCEIRAQIRRKPLDSDIIATLVVTITDAVNGMYEFGLPVSVTATLPAGATLDDAKSTYVWDMELQDAAGIVRPLYYGEAKIFREVTR